MQYVTADFNRSVMQVLHISKVVNNILSIFIQECPEQNSRSPITLFIYTFYLPENCKLILRDFKWILYVDPPNYFIASWRCQTTEIGGITFTRADCRGY